MYIHKYVYTQTHTYIHTYIHSTHIAPLLIRKKKSKKKSFRTFAHSCLHDEARLGRVLEKKIWNVRALVHLLIQTTIPEGILWEFVRLSARACGWCTHVDSRNSEKSVHSIYTYIHIYIYACMHTYVRIHTYICVAGVHTLTAEILKFWKFWKVSRQSLGNRKHPLIVKKKSVANHFAIGNTLW